MSPPYKKESKNKQAKKHITKRAILKQKLKKNFGSLQEGHGRAFLQKKAIVKHYYREQKKEEGKQRKKLQYEMSKGKDSSVSLDPPDISNPGLSATNTEPEDDDFPLNLPQKKRKLNSMQRARAEYHKKVAEREKKQEDYVKKQAEIEEAKNKYKERRLQKFKKLSQKTKRGQPVMKGRIELMLETLQNEMKV